MLVFQLITFTSSEPCASVTESMGFARLRVSQMATWHESQQHQYKKSSQTVQFFLDKSAQDRNGAAYAHKQHAAPWILRVLVEISKIPQVYSDATLNVAPAQ